MKLKKSILIMGAMVAGFAANAQEEVITDSIAIAPESVTETVAVAEEPQLSPIELKIRQMVEDGVIAPDFTLKDIQGNDVRLSDYLGDWVVLDFWGSWCGWCIKGIPEMKKAYEKYHPKGLEIIGIDCNEPEANWRAGVEKYQLPWVNVYNPEPAKQGLCAEYAVPGFPTKVLINPEGRIYDIVVGEDPAFYQMLDSLFENMPY